MAPKLRRKLDMANQTQAELVLERFGGYAAMSEMTGKSEQTIRNWVRAKTIPQKYHLPILRRAQLHGIRLLPHDLVSHLVTEMIAAAPGSAPETPDTASDAAAG